MRAAGHNLLGLVGTEAEHNAAPQNRVLQKTLAKDVTTRVHGPDELTVVQAATDVLFGKGTLSQLQSLSDEQFLSVFKGAGVPVAELPRAGLNGMSVIDLVSDHAKLLASKGEAKKLMQGNGLSINKEKVTDLKAVVDEKQLINGRYLLLQKGKKDYCLVKVIG